MDPNNPGPSIVCRLDRQLAWHRGASVRYLGVELTAPPAADASAASARRPLNLALVVDASGSMGGAALTAAKEGLLRVTERLEDDDVLSVVSFDDEVTVHASGQRLGDGRAATLAAVAGIEAGGSTDLGAGWLKGAACAAQVMESASERLRNRIVVLSDGHANRGILDPAELAVHSEQLRIRGLTSSAVGIGDGYSPVQLEAIAASGGGRLHRADNPGELVEVMLGELEDSESTAFEDLVLAVRVQHGTRLDMLSAFPASFAGDELRAALGSIGAGRTLLAVVRVEVPAGPDGNEISFDVDLSWLTPGHDSRDARNCSGAATIRFARGTENDAQSRDLDFSAEVARAWQTSVVRRAVGMNRQHDYRGARSFINEQLKHFRRYCQGIPGGDQLVFEMERLNSSIVRDWDERSRQEAELSSYKSSRRERDVRANAAPSWVQSLPPEERPQRSRPPVQQQ